MNDNMNLINNETDSASINKIASEISKPALEPSAHAISINVTAQAFQGLAKQNMTCNQGVCELCDNAIAAAAPGEKAKICISLAPAEDENHIILSVADWGVGMDLAGLENALQLGSIPTSGSRLNEHGFGLDNALASLSGGSGGWTIYSHKGDGAYYKVSGPFDIRMTALEDANLDLPTGLELLWPKPATVIIVKVPLLIAKTLQRRGGKTTDLVSLRDRLVEHLGVAYRGYLDLDPESMEPAAKIVVMVGKDKSGRSLVPPVQVPIRMGMVKRFSLELGGEVVPIEYRYGVLDQDKRDHLVNGEKAKYYYQNNLATQGIDIRLGKRVIATAQLEQIWRNEKGDPLARHNGYNEFVGEVLIPELPRGTLSTLNNKTGVDPNDVDWIKLYEALAQFAPPKSARAASEKALQASGWICSRRSAPATRSRTR